MKYTLYREDENGIEQEYNLEVEYKAYAGCRGRRDKYGVQEEPDDDPELEILSVTNNNVDFELTDAEQDKVEEACWDDANADVGYGDYDDDDKW